ncbi:hypothetical protein bplSymb_SCF01002P017 [Bathymodiolus platifrons methanotrophic gill symbiont]|nr:hypothetical protein BMR10_06900 [Methylococcaceae bacterium CS4]TXL01101.1 hypothetical protein BMR11_00720 [Methylococcaceae bacterium CS5]TXL04536.1 hypothetical protein BMR09_12225 [Methylococcaceae bacterium CS3]TXL04920.1 hypothetical protein BMR07_11165 [Methylococcaceae bacterium CS1]TXL10612.1 hypothetical protein BMR08_08405 [Methylococcaceae bacterium CS2]GAW85646.1 hypothetical protein bplSymb_SCF01002P017 [Bathymodiolus platifrons methanotrophic gill symbiont]
MSLGRIERIHDELFQFLENYMGKHNGFNFMPRQTNHYGRLDRGYWFPGNDKYLLIGFYSGHDSFNKTSNICFQAHLTAQSGRPLNTCSIQLSNTPNSEAYASKKPVIENIMKKLGGFEVSCINKYGLERRWNRYYSTNNYLQCIEEFVSKDKPVIDYIIEQANNPHLGFLEEVQTKQKISSIISRRVL